MQGLGNGLILTKPLFQSSRMYCAAFSRGFILPFFGWMWGHISPAN